MRSFAKLWQILYYSKLLNIEQIIYPSGHTGILFILLFLQKTSLYRNWAFQSQDFHRWPRQKLG